MWSPQPIASGVGPRRNRKSLSRTGFVVVFFLSCRQGAAQTEPVILHSAIECWPQTEFPILRATLQPGVEVVTAKAYFRSNMYPDFYYVELSVQPSGQGEAVLPKPSPETTSVIYYLEAVTRTFSSARSPEWAATVTPDADSCKRRSPATAWFEGDSPNIVVGATRVGAAAVPPGFQAQGLSGFVSAGGVVAGAGGGIGTGTAIVAIGGAAAGLGIVGASVGGPSDSSTTTPAAPPGPPPPVTPPSPPPTVPSGPAPLACYTTQPNPAIIQENESIRFDASCSRGDALLADLVSSYFWDFGNGKVVEGPDRRVVNTLYTAAGAYGVVLTVTDQSGNRSSVSSGVTVRAAPLPPPPPPTIPPPASADLIVTKQAPTTATVGGTIVYTVTVMNAGPATATGVMLTDTLPDGVSLRAFQIVPGTCPDQLKSPCTVGTLAPGGRAVLTITTVAQKTGPVTNAASATANEPDPNGASDKATTNVGPGISLPPDPVLENTLSSRLGSTKDARLRGELTVNGVSRATVDGVAPTPFRFSAVAGENVIEAEVPALRDDSDGFWAFDFAGAPHFVPGSIQVESGEVLSLGGQAVVFALREGAETRVRFRFRLAP